MRDALSEERARGRTTIALLWIALGGCHGGGLPQSIGKAQIPCAPFSWRRGNVFYDFVRNSRTVQSTIVHFQVGLYLFDAPERQHSQTFICLGVS